MMESKFAGVKSMTLLAVTRVRKRKKIVEKAIRCMINSMTA